MANKFETVSDSPTQTARSASAVTPHDTNPLGNVSKALFVGGAGNIALRLVDDSSDVTFTGVTAGSILPVRASHIRATSTTATNIVNLY